MQIFYYIHRKLKILIKMIGFFLISMQSVESYLLFRGEAQEISIFALRQFSHLVTRAFTLLLLPCI